MFGSSCRSMVARSETRSPVMAGPSRPSSPATTLSFWKTVWESPSKMPPARLPTDGEFRAWNFKRERPPWNRIIKGFSLSPHSGLRLSLHPGKPGKVVWYEEAGQEAEQSALQVTVREVGKPSVIISEKVALSGERNRSVDLSPWDGRLIDLILVNGGGEGSVRPLGRIKG